MEQEYLDVAIRAAQSSGDILLSYFGKLHDFKQKNQNIRDVVTEVDILSEKNIREKIKEVFPNHAIIGEESNKDNVTSDIVWHIDPLDGTVNYSQGITFCAVSVGLEVKGHVVVGVIFNPFTQELFYASKGQGAFLNGQPIVVSQKKEMKSGVYAVAFSSDCSLQKKGEYDIFGKMNDTTRGVLRTGSAAMNMAYLACGRIDGFWAKGLFSWDIAAGIILINEAGGLVMTLKNQEFKIGDSVLIASNKLLINDVCAQVSGI